MAETPLLQFISSLFQAFGCFFFFFSHLFALSPRSERLEQANLSPVGIEMLNVTYLQIRCEIRAKYNTHPNNSWTQAKSSEIFYAGIEVSKPSRRPHYLIQRVHYRKLLTDYTRACVASIDQWSYLTADILSASHILRDKLWCWGYIGPAVGRAAITMHVF